MIKVIEINKELVNKIDKDQISNGTFYFIESDGVKEGTAEGGWGKVYINKHWETALFKSRTDTNKCVSEALASKILKTMGIPCQETMLAENFPNSMNSADMNIRDYLIYLHENREHNFGVLCFDFLKGGENGDKLIEGEEINSSFNHILEMPKFLEEKYGKEVANGYIESVLTSAFLMNTDPNINNYGIIQHSNGSYEWAPNFDNESTLISPVVSTCGDFLNGEQKDVAFKKLKELNHNDLTPLKCAEINDRVNLNTCGFKIRESNDSNKYSFISYNMVFNEIAKNFPMQTLEFCNKLKNLQNFDFNNNFLTEFTELNLIDENFAQNLNSFLQVRTNTTLNYLTYTANKSQENPEL